MDEASGNQKGSLRNRLNVLNILMRISRKKKLRVRFQNINSNRIVNSNRFYLYFYTPVKMVIDDKLKMNKIVLYNKLNERNIKLNTTKSIKNINFDVIKNKKKKGINLDIIKEEINKKYELEKEKITDNLVQDYILIKNDLLFDEKVEDKLKEEFIKDRISVDEEINLIYSFKDSILIKDIDYDLKEYQKNEEKLKKLIEKLDKKLEMFEINLKKYDVITNNEVKITNLGVLFKNLFGLGIGILTLPLSYPTSLALGASLINKSINNIEKKVKVSNKETKVIKYRIELKDIITTNKALNSTDYLLEETLKKLDSLKYKISHNTSKIPEFESYLKKIEVLENALVKKKRELNKLLSKLEKGKVKVLKRENV